MKIVKMNYRLVMILVIAAMFLAAAPAYALITVSNTNDSGAGSLRQALADATPGETIDFSVTGTITLTSGELTIGQNQTITGAGAGSLTIDGNDNSRIFYINSSGATVNISGLTLTNGNSATYGGGIENEGTLNISDCVISGCDANGFGNGFGGAIDNYGGTVNITTCTISGNTAVNEGGGIRNETGTVTITESTISGNTSDVGGGIASRNNGSVDVIRSTIYNNNATSGGSNFGGGILCITGTLNLTNSTVSGNNAISGGGGIIDGTPPSTATNITITQCTITDNTSTNGGGGIELGVSTANIKNTILAGNTGGNGNNYYSTGGTLSSQGYNLEDSTEAGFTGTGDQQNATPNLAAIASNGGPTQTHALQAGSNAIDAIPEGGTGYNGAPTTDQRGFGRTGVNRDVGAFEYQGRPYISGNAGFGGATLSYNDGGTQTATADGSGNYSFFVSYNWSGTVTPSQTGYVFSPTSRSYTNVILQQTNQDYTAAVGYTISGTVTDGTNPIQGVTITFSHDGHTETTAADGTYSYSVPPGTTTTITPSHPGYGGWTPANRTINNISADQPNQDFQGTINFYTISGTVIDGTNPIQGVTITFSHNGHSETTAADGTYSYAVPYGTSTTITPSHPAYSGWTPPNRTINNISINSPNQDFQGTINTYTISGTVTDGANPIQGVTITFSHDGHTETTAADGTYSYTVPYGTTTTITPSHVGYSGWTPANRTINNISANQPNQNFQGTINTHTISGTVTDGANPIQGVTITFSHDGHTETTAADGTYSYTVPYGTTTTITPSHPGYSGWIPANRTINNIAANQPNQNFQGTINNYTISGTVIDGTNPIQGVTITFSHDGHTETTAADGTYSYIVPYGTTTTITPSHVGYSGWTPANRTVNNIPANQPNQDFQGTPYTYTISGTVTDGTNPIQGVTITFSHDSHTENTAADGTYSYPVPYGTTTTVTPSHAGHSGWTPTNRTINTIAADTPNQDFQGTINNYTISGTVTDGTNPIQGVTVTFSHDSHTENTAVDGTYSYTVPYGTTTTITPSHSTYTSWTPANHTITNIAADQPNQDFQGTAPPTIYRISGTVTFDNQAQGVGAAIAATTPLEGVTITFSHDGHTEITDANGYYSYNVDADTTTTITPSKEDYTFTPTNYTITNISADESNRDFTASPEPISITITEPQDGAEVSGTVTITATATSNAAAGADASVQAVAKMEFYIDDSIIAEDDTEPYEADWDTTTAADGTHTIKAVAYNLANATSEDEITAYVSNIPTEIILNRTRLNFGSTPGAGAASISMASANLVTGSQTILINNSGGGTLNWAVTRDAEWLTCTPETGTGPGVVTVSANPSGLAIGTYTAAITVQDPNASNSPQTVPVALKVYSSGITLPPFGYFETPIDGSTVMSSLPVTGWALDDIDVSSVKIYRAPIPGHETGGLVYIGDAVFVDGARPDVEQTFPDYPKQFQAGWGYMMLTNFLPNQGNGTFTIYAKAVDIEGHEVTLGSKTINCDNANAVKPFGAIDTPGQGGIARGSAYANFGWALTPQPSTIPVDGSTITVWVDGVPLGNPVYNQYREDIATLFPGYNNSNGAIGYYYLDTTMYANGVHTIAWSAEDNAGNSDGIGSRYFSIQNIGGSSLDLQATKSKASSINISRIQQVTTSTSPIFVKKGYRTDTIPEIVYPDDEGIMTIMVKEDERIEIQLSGQNTMKQSSSYRSSYSGYFLFGPHTRPLPLGSSMDNNNGIFYWQMGPAFFGEHLLVFLEKGPNGEASKKQIKVIIRPK